MTQNPPEDSNHSRRTLLRTTGLAALGLASLPTAMAQSRGNEGSNSDTVSGMYKSTYAYDANGDWYGENMSNRGLESGTVGSISELDQDTLTTCYYKVQYQGSFGDDPYLDMGWIKNNVVCKGYEPDNRNVLWVHESDPRYTGTGQPAFGGTWEVHVDSRRGEGNVLTDKVRPAQHS